MISGAFKRMIHDHKFLDHLTGTLMSDRFEFESPFGIFGEIANRFFLTAYMRRFLVRRNDVLKRLAESDAWRLYIEPT